MHLLSERMRLWISRSLFACCHLGWLIATHPRIQTKFRNTDKKIKRYLIWVMFLPKSKRKCRTRPARERPAWDYLPLHILMSTSWRRCLEHCAFDAAIEICNGDVVAPELSEVSLLCPRLVHARFFKSYATSSRLTERLTCSGCS